MNRSGCYNLVTIFFTGLTVAVLVFVFIQMSGPGPAEEVGVLPTLAPPLPTLTASFTPSRTIPPTFTPTPSLTPTLTPTLTITPSITPTHTVSPSPTITDTPAASPTPTITETSNVSPTPGTPTATPLPPYLFGQSEQTFFTSNFANSLQCAWQGIGGQIFDMQGLEVTTPYRVHVYGPGMQDLFITTPSNSNYGPSSGWEAQVASTVNANTYYVELQTSLGTPISAPVQVTFTQDCTKNVAIVKFKQIQALP